jgi:hypothetical protein
MFRQSIKWVNARTGKILGSFSSAGKAEGQIYYPRSIQRYKDDLLVMVSEWRRPPETKMRN